MLRRKDAYTVITPIPSFIPRQLALDILHSHSEVITLNPLVLSHKPITAPRTAAADEFYSTWYEITERVQLIPGAGRLGSSKIVFNGCFHDMPWGLQTHINAPMNIDLRNRYTVGGNQPGEPPAQRELGLESLGVPKDGLYLREDIEIRCNISLVSFVKAQLKAASKEMVQRIIRKAELLDAGVLQAMMSHDGRLRTINPNDRSEANAAFLSNMSNAPSSPRPMSFQPVSPSHPHYVRTDTPLSRGYSTASSAYNPRFNPAPSPPPIPPKERDTSSIVMELPGDTQYYNVQSGRPPSSASHMNQSGVAPHHYPPSASPTSSHGRWSHSQSSQNQDPYRQSTGSANLGPYSAGGHTPPGATAELPART